MWNVHQVLNGCNLTTCLHVFLPTALGEPQGQECISCCLDHVQVWKSSSLSFSNWRKDQLWEMLPQDAQTGSEKAAGVKGWSFKTLGLVNMDLNFCLTQLASEKPSLQSLTSSKFSKNIALSVWILQVLSQPKGIFPFKQKLFRHFQDMKCSKPGFSTQTTRKLFVDFFPPRLLLFAKKSEERFFFFLVLKMFPTSVPLCFSILYFVWILLRQGFKSENRSCEMQNYTCQLSCPTETGEQLTLVVLNHPFFKDERLPG